MENSKNYSKAFLRYMDAIQEIKKVCKCGYKVPMIQGRGYGICINCSQKVYGDKKLEFRDKLKQKMKEGIWNDRKIFFRWTRSIKKRK